MRLIQDAAVAIMIACLVLSAYTVLSATSDGRDRSASTGRREPVKSGRTSILQILRFAQVELPNLTGRRTGQAASQAQPNVANATVPDGGSTAAWLGLGLLGLSYLGASNWGRNRFPFHQRVNTEQKRANPVSPVVEATADRTEKTLPAERRNLWR